MKTKKIKEMEELIEIKNLKEKHCKELEQIQAELIQEKSFLFALQEQNKMERKKEQKFKNKTAMDCRYEGQQQNVYDCQYSEPLDLQCQKSSSWTFPDMRENSPNLGDNYTDKRYSSNHPNQRYQNMKNRKCQNNKPQPEKRTDPTRFNNVPDLQDYQHFFNAHQPPLQNKNEDYNRRRSLDMTHNMKISPNYMNAMEREEMMRNEMMKQHNTYKQTMPHGMPHSQMTQQNVPDYRNHFPDMLPNLPPPSHKRSHSIGSITPYAGQMMNDKAKPKDGLEDDVCEGCGKMAFFICSACMRVNYCTIQCQVSSCDSLSTIVATVLKRLFMGLRVGFLLQQVLITGRRRCENESVSYPGIHN